jgi:hypothetical protein
LTGQPLGIGAEHRRQLRLERRRRFRQRQRLHVQLDIVQGDRHHLFDIRCRHPGGLDLATEPAWVAQGLRSDVMAHRVLDHIAVLKIRDLFVLVVAALAV